jgi:recombination protein RecR
MGRYFVLMGHISPIDGIGPEDLAIPSLIHQCTKQATQEVILATNSTVEGEVTAQYIVDQLKPHNISCSRIGHGVPIGGELEYLDGNTVKQALLARRNWLKNPS